MDNQKKQFIKLTLCAILITIFSMSCGAEKGMERKEAKEAVKSTPRKEKVETDKRRMALKHFRRGENYFRNGELDKAENEIKAAISLDPNHPIPHLLLGDIYFAKKEYQDALGEYERAKAIDKSKALPYAKIANVYMELGRNEKAVEALRAAIRLEPDVPALHEQLGKLYRRMGLEDEAKTEYRRARDSLAFGSKYGADKTSEIAGLKRLKGAEYLDPRVEKVLKLGDEFLKDGLVKLAIEEFKIAVKLDPNSLVTNQKLGDAYVKKGMLEEAIAQYERVKNLKQDSPLGYLGLGIAHARMFEIDKAISFFKKGISLDPNFPPLHFELAMAYVKADRLQEAISELEKTVKLDSVNPEPGKALEKVREEKETEKGFATIQKGPFIVKFDPGQDGSFINYVVRLLLEAYQKLTVDFSYQPKQKIIVKIYPDLRQFHFAATTPQWFKGGVAATKDYKILLATPKRERNIKNLEKVLTHELTHVFTNLVTFSNHPTWIHEGIALWEAGQWDLGKEKIVGWAIRNDRLFTLNELEKPFTRFKDPRSINLAYAESYTAVKFVLDRYGQENLLKILYDFSKGSDFEEAARHVLGMSAEQFEKKWFDSMKKAYG